MLSNENSKRWGLLRLTMYVKPTDAGHSSVRRTGTGICADIKYMHERIGKLQQTMKDSGCCRILRAMLTVAAGHHLHATLTKVYA